MSYPRLTVSYPERGTDHMVAAVLEPSRMNPGRWNVWNGGKRPIDTITGLHAATMFPEHADAINNFDRFR